MLDSLPDDVKGCAACALAMLAAAALVNGAAWLWGLARVIGGML